MASTFKTIGLVVRSDMQSRQQSIQQVVTVLARHAEVRVHCLDFDEPMAGLSQLTLKQLVNDVDLVISLGGDGTLLTAARALADLSTPLLGINLGRLGFLADVSFDHFESYIDAVVEGRYTVEERFLSRVSFTRVITC